MTKQNSKIQQIKTELENHKFNSSSYIVMNNALRREAATGRLTSTQAKSIVKSKDKK